MWVGTVMDNGENSLVTNRGNRNSLVNMGENWTSLLNNGGNRISYLTMDEIGSV